MDKKTKRLFANMLLEKNLHDKCFENRLLSILSELNESTLLYLANAVEIPYNGEKIIADIDGDKVEATVEAVNLLDGTISLTYTKQYTRYFTTAEAAAKFITTGQYEYNTSKERKFDDYKIPASTNKSYSICKTFAELYA